MGNKLRYTKSSHSVYYLKYHIVWVCKYRRKVLNPGVCSYLTKVIYELIKSMPGVTIEEIGFGQDHLHFVASIPPKYSIANVIGQLKSQSASKARKKFSFLQKVFWKENLLWSPGYFVSSIGADEETILNYVKHQGEQDLDQQTCLL